MVADILNKPKSGAAFRRNRAKLMNVPVDYDDKIEARNIHPDLLPSLKTDTLGNAGIQKSSDPSRSVLSNIGNQRSPGILRNSGNTAKKENKVSWRDVVMGVGPLPKGNHYS